MQAAARVVGAATALQRGSGAAAGQLLGLLGSPAESASRLADASRVRGRPVASGFRSPYRIDGETLMVLDQRRYPDVIVELPCAAPSQVVSAIQARQVLGAPLLAQVAAYGVWLAALAAREMPAHAHASVIQGHAASLRQARPHVATVGWAVERVLGAWEAVGGAVADPDAAIEAIRRAADDIATELSLDLARLVAAGAAALPQREDLPLDLLTLDSTGALAGGMIGTAVGVIQALAAAGRPVHAWVLETQPYGTGARLAAWELAQAGVSTTVVADGSAGWLLARAGLDAALVGADRIAADGATTAVIGTYGLAELARRHTVPLWVASPLAALDAGIADAAGSAVESEAYATVTDDEPGRLHGTSVDVRGPLQDVTPPELIDGILTEVGLLRPPFGAALASASREREAGSELATVLGRR